MSLLDLASLVLAPTATKEGKVYSAIPDTGEGDMTFSRGSSATRVNSAGLIEKERGNLLLQSNTFNTTWTQVRADFTSGQSGYDGSSDAWQVECNANGYSGGYQNTSSLNQVNCSSLYAKAGNVDYLFIATTQGSTNNSQFFNLTNGTLGTSIGTGIIDANIESVGNGWYRCSITMTPNASFGYFLFGLSDTDGSSTGAIGEYIYIQDAMLNQGLVAQPYIETTTTAVYEGITDDVPRVDYTDSSCPALLLEPQRTNILPQSEYVNSTDWDIGAGVTITNNYAESPEGVQNATRAQFGATGVNRVFFDRAAATSDADNVWSFYIKGTDGETIDCYIDGNATGTGYYYFGKYITLDGTWQRIEFPFTLPANAGTQNYVVRRQEGNTATEALFYGFQVEASASYATSYIPTYGSSVTRGEDTCTNADVSSLLGSGVGTAFIDMVVNGQDTQGNIPLTIGTGTTNLIYLWFKTNLTVTYEAYTGGSLQADISTSSGFYTYGDRIKVALVWADNDFAMYINGTQIGTDTSGTAPTPTKLWLGQYTSGNYKGATIKQAILFPTRLTNDQLEELTK